MDKLFLSKLDLIDEVIASTCRRHACFGPEAEEFASRARFKLLDNDYAVLRKFDGKSSLATYITVVVQNLFRDYEIRKWGRWRSSARAGRLGALAVQLETLLYRDGHSLEEAIQILKTNHRVPQDPRELRQLAVRLPHRQPRRFEGEDQLRRMPSEVQADDCAREHELEVTARRTQAALGQAVAALPAQERLILKMRFEDGMTVPEISAALNVKQRRLYSRIDNVLSRIRYALKEQQIGGLEIEEILGWKGLELKIDFVASSHDEVRSLGRQLFPRLDPIG